MRIEALPGGIGHRLHQRDDGPGRQVRRQLQAQPAIRRHQGTGNDRTDVADARRGAVHQGSVGRGIATDLHAKGTGQRADGVGPVVEEVRQQGHGFARFGKAVGIARQRQVKIPREACVVAHIDLRDPEPATRHILDHQVIEIPTGGIARAERLLIRHEPEAH